MYVAEPSQEMLWWVAVTGMLLPNVTVGDGSYAAFGVGGHFMVILPELQMIIAHIPAPSKTAVRSPATGANSSSRSNRSVEATLRRCPCCIACSISTHLPHSNGPAHAELTQ